MSKTALITGGASGLGYELALLLAKDDYNLVLIDIDAEKLQEVKQGIETDFAVNVQIYAKDLSVVNISEEIMLELKGLPIDVLVNNAGFGLFGSFWETDWEREKQMLHLHVITTTHLTKLVLKDMIQRGSGKILNLSSLAAFQPGPLMSLYYATKGYILSFSEAIANELKGTGVTVTALCPGPTKTSFQKVVSNASSENKITFNMANAKEVAAYGYKAMNKGKVYAIPGKFNKLLATLPRFIPRNTAATIVKRIQEKNREA
ncbi:MAG: short-chain dehydrogenase [Xanthomarina sp.]|uniref:SDR family NAD(P)-dependent oxidoreductase n=1 Tax=Xanthomarina TaxID=1868329 RepID=UPI000C5A881D|nr:SDR family oxidoreductase [Xanthomarina sp.]MAL23772.1 short-chain dehydrogenase [Xanthomarina sp.]MBF62222.1 short-chain dehydrogenase [Xanthomarina sp.]HAB26429.1 short-chain dehydrogenase [Xanthomarina gelatinilytica]HAI19916.1 short-chain dehydrogenase [Xanthomarina gelatinilytica]|tara:strand:+ start:325 stop:1107 length:783 start_codon:yes stop_codon:yes gene_type:complete